MLHILRRISCIAVLSILFTSCINYQGVKDTPYFKDLPDSTSEAIRNATYHPLTIQPGDVLSIVVNTLDGSSLFNSQVSSNVNMTINQPVSQTANINPMSGVGGYTVDKDGNIELPLVGKVFVKDMDLVDVKNTLSTAIGKYYKNAAVNVKLSNFFVNMLGSVSRPGKYMLTGEKSTLFDALAAAGDLTLDAKRTNLILIRDSAGHSVMTRFSLNTKNIVNQDFYYLKQNDIIYVEPNKYAAKNANMDRSMLTYLSIGISALSVLVVAINSITK